MADWQLWVRGTDREWLGVIDDELSFTATPRHLELGAWQITVQAGTPSADLLLEGAGVVLLDGDGTVLMSGPKRPMERSNDASPDGDTITVTGVDDTAALARIVYPSPGTAITSSGTTHSAEHWTRTGPGEDVLRDLIDTQAGPEALSGRRVPGLVIPESEGRGRELTSQLRLDKLLEAGWAIAEAVGLGFHVVQDEETTDLHLRIYEPRDLADSVRFGAHLGNLASYSYEASPPEVTDVIVAAGGEGTDRMFFHHQRRDDMWPDVIVEEVIDARDLALEPGDGDEDWVDPEEGAEQRATERLDEGEAKASVEFVPIDTDALTYGADYHLGDRVTAEIDIGDVTNIIREVVYTRDPTSGEVVAPAIGEAQDQPQIYKRVARIRSDVDKLQNRR